MTIVRRTGGTTAATLLGIATAILVAHLVAPEWAHQNGLDVWTLQSAIAGQEDCRQDAAILSAKEHQLTQEIQLTDGLAAQLAARTKTLEAAVDELEPILAHRQGFIMVAQPFFGTTNLRQTVGRFLIARIAKLKLGPAAEKEIVAELEKQLAQLN